MLWFNVKSTYWWLASVLSGSLVVYQFSESLIIALFIFPIMQSANYLFSRNILQTLKSLVLMTFFIAIDLLLLFGTYIGQKDFSATCAI